MLLVTTAKTVRKEALRKLHSMYENAFASAARPAVHDIVLTTIRVLNGQARLGYAIGGRTW